MPTIEWIAQVTGGQIHHPDPQDIIGFSIDSRTLRPGEFFIALPGERTDGHHFLEEAFRKGASGALVRKIPSSHEVKNCVQIPDTLIGLQQLAAAYRQQHDIPIIGITGSSGKTTTKELLHALLSQKYKSYRSPGNYNTEIGLPIALLNMPAGTEIGAFELGLQRPGEIKVLSEIVRPTIGVITSIGDAHLGFFKDRESLAQAKWELIERLPEKGLAVLNSDSPYLARWTSLKTMRVIGFGIEHGEVRAEWIRDEDVGGLAFQIRAPKGCFEVRTRLLGRANVYNMLAAVAVALELGVDTKRIQKTLAAFKPLPHRMELKRSKRFGLILDDSYNANPASTKEALYTLARLQVPYRKVFVFGDMLELGDFSVDLHREIANAIAESGVERLFTIGELAKETAQALLKRANWGRERVMSASSLEELKELLISELDDRNLILVKGSRGMGLDQLVEALM